MRAAAANTMILSFISVVFIFQVCCFVRKIVAKGLLQAGLGVHKVVYRLQGLQFGLGKGELRVVQVR